MEQYTSRIIEYQQMIKEAESAINEYIMLLPELKNIRYYNSVDYYKSIMCCAKDLIKHANLIIECQKQIKHMQKDIDNSFED